MQNSKSNTGVFYHRLTELQTKKPILTNFQKPLDIIFFSAILLNISLNQTRKRKTGDNEMTNSTMTETMTEIEEAATDVMFDIFANEIADFQDWDASTRSGIPMF